MDENMMALYLAGCALTLGWSLRMIIELFSEGVPGAIGYLENIIAGGLTVAFLLVVPLFSWLSAGYILASSLNSIERKLAFQVKELLEPKIKEDN